MTDQTPKPATDKEIAGIAAWNCDCEIRHRTSHYSDCLILFGPALIARIERDRAEIAAKDAEIAALKYKLAKIRHGYGCDCGDHR